MVSGSEGRQQDGTKMVTRGSFAVAVVIIVLLSSVLAFVAVDIYHIFPRDFNHDDYYYVHWYQAKIFPSSSENYSILIPIPVVPQSNTTYRLFPEDLHVDSPNVALQLITTEHGISLQVSGNTSVNISWSDGWNTNSGTPRYSSLSMMEPSNVSSASSAVVYFRSSGTPVGFSIDHYTRFQYGYGARSDEFFVDAIAVGEGWHQAIVSIRSILFN